MRTIPLFLFGIVFLSVSLTHMAFAADTAAPPSEAAPAVEAPAPVPVEVKPVLVDLNTATKSELKTLPWIGDIFSKAIMEGRPYASLEDFAARRVIPLVTYEKIKDRITVTQE